MCNIIIGKANRILEVVDTEWSHNPHGAGVAWPTREGWAFRKGIMRLKELKEILEKLEDKDAIIHLRFATHGSVTPEMTHPFVLDPSRIWETEGIAKRLLFHNGTIASMGSSKSYSYGYSYSYGSYGGYSSYACNSYCGDTYSTKESVRESDTAELARLICILPAHKAIEYAWDTGGGRFAVTDYIDDKHKVYITQNFKYNEEYDLLTSAGL